MFGPSDFFQFQMPGSESGRGMPMGGPGLPPFGRIGERPEMSLVRPPAPMTSSMPQARTGWRERLMQGLFPSQGMEGLLDPAAMKGARSQGLLGLGAGLLEMSGEQVGPAPSMGQALANGLRRGQESYSGAVQNGLMVDQHKQALAAKQLRQRLAQKYQFDPSAPLEQQVRTGRGMMMELLQAGDTEGAGKISEWLKSVEGQLNKPPVKPWEIDRGGKTEIRHPDGRTELLDKFPNARDPNAPASADLLREQRMFDRTNRLQDDFRNEAKMIAGAADQYRTLTSNVEAAKKGIPQAQIAMVFAFMKTLDPGSVVREGEYATAANAAGVPERVRNQYNKVVDGSFLSPEQVQGFADQAKSTAVGWRRKQEGMHRVYGQRARRWKIDPDDVILDYFEGIDDAPAAPARTGTNRLLP